MAADEGNPIHQVQQYRKMVLVYEALDEKIDALLMLHGGFTEQMSPQELQHYRELARQRDDVQNEMRALEHELQIDEEDTTVMD
jgi:hypothetical protein